jgi:hypothetical protein
MLLAFSGMVIVVVVIGLVVLLIRYGGGLRI